MKKLFFILFTILSCAVAAQDKYTVESGSVVFTKVYENTGKTIEQMHSKMESFFAKSFVDVNSTEKLNQSDHFIYKGLFLDTGRYQMGMWTIDVPFTIDVSIKENRMRVKIIITTGTYRSLNAPTGSEYYILEAAPFPIVGKNKWIKKETENTFSVVTNRCENLFNEIKEEINTESSSDW